ncbi:MAG: histidine phosphatase family protein, partial [Mycobacteriales bacterium]
LDPGLSDHGRRQAEQVAAALSSEPLTAVYSSPMRRARETAEVIAQRHDLSVSVAAGLAEFDRGATYLHFEDMDADSPYHLYLQGDLTPWGTTAEDFRKRVVQAFDEIVAAHPGSEVAVVSHGGVHNAFLGQVLGISSLHFHAPAYAGISRVQASTSGVRTIVSLNETMHQRCDATVSAANYLSR